MRKGETYLKAQIVFEKKLKVAELRICIHHATGRYLIGITENQRDYIPIILDLKTGEVGENMSLEAKKKVRKAILSAFDKVMNEYLTHSDQMPHATVYEYQEIQ